MWLKINLTKFEKRGEFTRQGQFTILDWTIYLFKKKKDKYLHKAISGLKESFILLNNPKRDLHHQKPETKIPAHYDLMQIGLI